jgi:hypothetical protein
MTWLSGARAVAPADSLPGGPEHRPDRRPGMAFGSRHHNCGGDVALGTSAPLDGGGGVSQRAGVFDAITGWLMLGEPAGQLLRPGRGDARHR